MRIKIEYNVLEDVGVYIGADPWNRVFYGGYQKIRPEEQEAEVNLNGEYTIEEVFIKKIKELLGPLGGETAVLNLKLWVQVESVDSLLNTRPDS